ncbi:hypothetical protein PENSPDRAFT_646919 [Peniophora sp. CONT]|nr:hypothetical protein PENSPDRAFT_646919 [Peniophora sp. CONT]
MAASAPATRTQPRRKSARIKSTHNNKVDDSNSSAGTQKPLSISERSRKKPKVVEAPPREIVDLTVDDDSEVEELPTRAPRGSLRKLLDIPLDVLLEIFTHVMPDDLLNVARTNKSFAALLLSRRSISIWRATLDTAYLNAGYPPTPEGWTELAWVQLVSGSRACSLCGKRTTFDVLWAFRKRLCKACRDNHIVYHGDRRVEHILRDADKDIGTIIPSCRLPGSRAAVKYLWIQDVLAYHRGLEKLSRECQDRALFLLKREELDTQMANRTQPILDHARLCEEGAVRLKEGQVADKEKLTIQRVTLIYERLLALGFEAADLEEPLIRHHKDVDNPRLLTKAVWDRLKPTLVELAKQSRKIRLEREVVERRTARMKAVATEYRTFLTRVAPSAVSLMPTVDEVLHFPQVCAAIAKDKDATDELHKTVAKALDASLPDFFQYITTRADVLRNNMPDLWPVAQISECVPSKAASSSSSGPSLLALDLPSSIAELDLVAYTFACGRAKQATSNKYCDVQHDGKPEVHYGLDILAHACALSGLAEDNFKPLPAYHRAVLRILKLLELDPVSTTVTMLDTLDPAFVDSSSLRGLTDSQLYKLLTWREAVERVKHCEGRKTSGVRSLTVSERQWFNTKVIGEGGRLSTIPLEVDWWATPIERLPVWGCCHCFAHLNSDMNEPLERRSQYDDGWRCYDKLCGSHPDDPWRWFTLSQVRAHLIEFHKIDVHRDGQDYFSNRHVSRRKYTSFSCIPANLGVGEPLQFA